MTTGTADDTTAGGPRRRRLVLRRSGDDHAPRLEALCFAPDGGEFALPAEVHELDAPQPLPPVPVGALVDVVDADAARLWPARDRAVPLVRLRSTSVRAGSRDGGRSDQPDPGFAQARGGRVVVHPDHAGAVSRYAWNGRAGDALRDSAFARTTTWLSEARRRHRRAWAGIVAGAAVAVAVVVAWAVFDVELRRPGRVIGSGIGLALVSIPIVAAARRRFAVADERARLDVDTAPHRRMRVTAWWAMGHDRPVELWLTLFQVDPDGPGGVVSLPVLDVPATLDLPDDGIVTVIGTPAHGELVVVEFAVPGGGTVRLEPGGRARADVLGPAWLPVPGDR